MIFFCLEIKYLKSDEAMIKDQKHLCMARAIRSQEINLQMTKQYLYETHCIYNTNILILIILSTEKKTQKEAFYYYFLSGFEILKVGLAGQKNIAT